MAENVPLEKTSAPSHRSADTCRRVRLEECDILSSDSLIIRDPATDGADMATVHKPLLGCQNKNFDEEITWADDENVTIFL